MKKIILAFITIMALCACCTINEKACNSNQKLQDQGISTVEIWNRTIELTTEQISYNCMDFFELSTNQSTIILDTIKGKYISTENINIIDESLNTNIQAYADENYYDKSSDPLIKMIKKKVINHEIEIKNKEILFDGNSLKNYTLFFAVQNEQKVPVRNLVIIGYNNQGNEIRLFFSSDVKNTLSIIENVDLKKDGYGIYEVYKYFKRC